MLSNCFAFLAPDHAQDSDEYFMESADKIGYFYEKSALDGDGELLVDASLALNKVGHALHRLHPVFERCTYSGRVRDVCRALGMVKPVVPQSMYIYKNPGIGSEGEYGKNETIPKKLLAF